MTQLLIDFPEPVIFPDGFNSLREYAVYVQQQASLSRTGTHTQRLSGTVVIEYIHVLPSLILEREDGQAWHSHVIENYAYAFFGTFSFRQIQLETAGGYKSKRGMVEITPNFKGLQNFRVVK